jgi:hypothetical protein
MKRTLIAILCIYATTSCKKEYVAPTVDLTNYVKQSVVTENGSTVTYDYSYDYAGRITEMKYGNEKITYEYTTTGFIEHKGSQKTQTTLGAMFGYFDSTSTNDGGVKYVYSNNWNLLRIYYYDSKNKRTRIDRFEWDDDTRCIKKEWNEGHTIDYSYTRIPDITEKGYKYSRKNRYLVSKAEYSTGGSFEYDYVIDSKGRITKETMTSGGNIRSIKTYTY